MGQLIAFMKKEWTENIRTGKFLLLMIIFVLFGIMNPAIAKLTPWLFHTLSQSMQEQGIVIQEMVVNALTSWQQYYKNISMMLIVAIVMFSGVMTNEYQKGTLINILTKGMPRWKIIASKSIIQIALWSLCYWSAFGITYGYTAYFWDNSIASHFLLAAALVYLMGIWLISLIFLGSSFLESNVSVLIFTGLVFFGVYLAGMLPEISEYLPTKLLSSGDLLTGKAVVTDFIKSGIITAISGSIFWTISILRFNKKHI